MECPFDGLYMVPNAGLFNRGRADHRQMQALPAEFSRLIGFDAELFHEPRVFYRIGSGEFADLLGVLPIGSTAPVLNVPRSLSSFSASFIASVLECRHLLQGQCTPGG